MNARSSRTGLWPTVASVVLLTAAACLAYWPALTGGFVWDDDVLVTDSVLVKASDGLYRMWFTTEPLDYWPLTNSSFWVEWRLWGLHPTGYHVTNLSLHVGSALLLWAILKRLRLPGALFAAFLFVLHPVNVESVAWIAQRKNTLSMFFFLLSILWYLRFDRAPADPAPPPAALPLRGKARPGKPEDAPASPSLPSDAWYWLSLAAFVLAMLSKGSVAILPGVLLLFAWWRRGTIAKTDLVRSAPFFAIAIGLTALNVWFQGHLMTAPIRTVTPVERLLDAGAIVWFYLLKALFPIRLTFVYPLWDVRGDDLRWWLPLLAALAVTALLVWQRRRPAVRALLFAWLFVGLALLPVMGLTDVYYMRYSLVADHYQYIAILGIAAVVAAGLAQVVAATEQTGGILQRAGLRRPAGVWLWSALLLAAPATATYRQSQEYVDAETLYRSTLAKNPSAWLVQNLLGLQLVPRAMEEAIAHFKEAARLQPGALEPHNNLCQAAQQVGRPGDAIDECAAAVRLNPNTPTAHNGLGTALNALGRPREAQAEFERALALNSNYADAHNNLANVLVASGHEAEAIDHYRQALAITPSFVDARRNLGLALDRLGRRDEAIEQYRETLRLDGSLQDVRARLDVLMQKSGVAGAIERYQEAVKQQPGRMGLHVSLADALLEAGRAEEAVTEYTLALAGLPLDPAVHLGLASALADAGRAADAEPHFREALRLKPDFAEARRHFGDLLQAEGRLPDAVEQYTAALAHEPKNPETHNNLGVVLVRLGRRDDGLAQFRAALALEPNYTDARNNLNKTMAAR